MNVRSTMNDKNETRSVEVSRQADLSSALEQIRSEAEQIIASAQAEIAQIRSQTLAAIQHERQALEERAFALDAARKQLDEDANVLEQQYRQMQDEAFEDARKKGYEQGLKEGKKEGYKVGKEEATASFEQKAAEEVSRRTRDACDVALAPIRKLVHEMKGTRQALLKNWEENILQISAAIAYQTIMREPTLLNDAPLDLLREALELAMNCATLKIRMNPRDVENLNDSIRTILEETGNLAKSEVVSDPKITPGGCLVETSLGVVDERLESRLERIVAELSE